MDMALVYVQATLKHRLVALSLKERLRSETHKRNTVTGHRADFYHSLLFGAFVTLTVINQNK